MTYGLDTSALLRLLVGVPEGLAQKVNDRLFCLINEGHKVHVSKLVLSEAYFALQTHYGLTKDQSIESLTSLRTMPGFVLDSSVAEVFATPRLGRANPGFVDRMIVADYSAGDETTISLREGISKTRANGNRFGVSATCGTGVDFQNHFAVIFPHGRRGFWYTSGMAKFRRIVPVDASLRDAA